MNVEYTGRHYEITTAVRDEIENGLLENPQDPTR